LFAYFVCILFILFYLLPYAMVNKVT